ncbi:MAG TPA: hypothetical protein VGA00_04925 [Acidiferrobacterales bacterium]
MITRSPRQTLALTLAAGLAAPAASATAPSFNPDVSLILSGSFSRFSRDPDSYALPGFPLAAETGPGEQGLSLAESELVLSANIDPWFFGYFTGAVTPENEFEVEEAYIQTLALPAGVRVKAGRFLSGIGYLNELHPHAWDFVDAPLAYRAFLGGQLGDDGVQITWLAPGAGYVQLGGEWLRGESYPAGGAARDGRGTATAFARVGGDAGASHSYRFGLSHIRARADQRLSGDIEDAPDAFDGKARVTVADFVWKWAPGGNPVQTNFKLQGEYLWRREDGEFTVDVNGVAPGMDDYRSNQTGWYLQTVYQFMPRWRAGLRHDRLRTRDLDAGANAAALDTGGHAPRRSAAMLDFSPSEFSRVRLQFNRDTSQPEADNQLMLQYLTSLGAHGAHRF